jgi:hypothetical protein
MIIYKLGAILGKKSVKNLRLSNYLPPDLPDPPPSIDWITGRESKLAMRHNNEVGNCVEVAFWNTLAVDADNSGDTFQDDFDGALRDYETITGYDPANPDSDQGTDPEVALKFYSNLPDDDPRKILAYCEVNRYNLREVRQALQIFGGLYTALALPASAQEQVGKVWDVPLLRGPLSVPGSWGGHMVLQQRIDVTSIPFGESVDTWGTTQAMTEAFRLKYCSAQYVFITPEWIAANGMAPSGVNLQQMLDDVAVLKE